MLIGVLSDTHGQVARTRLAVKLFDTLGVAHLIHCGDVGGMEVLDELVGRPCHFVWGNTDFPEPSLTAYLKATGFPEPADPPPTQLELGGKSIAVFHGHERDFASAPTALAVDYIFHGHTHEARDQKVGRVRVVNPGALHRVRVPTVATIDLARDVVQFHELPD
jgi:putative phosphoesterase